MKSLAGVFALMFALTASGPAAQDRVLVLDGATLIDGTGRSPVPDAVIVMEGGRITQVGKNVAIPRRYGRSGWRRLHHKRPGFTDRSSLTIDRSCGPWR